MTAPDNIHVRCVYSRGRLYAWRRLWMENRNNNNKLSIDVETFNTLRQLRILRYRGSRGGRRKQKPIAVRITRDANQLPALHNRRFTPPLRCLSISNIQPDNVVLHSSDSNSIFPNSIYVVNARSLAKAHAISQLQVELLGYNIDIAI